MILANTLRIKDKIQGYKYIVDKYTKQTVLVGTGLNVQKNWIYR